jgi:hypothetical protein
LDSPGGLAFDTAGDLFETDGGSGEVFEYTNALAAEKGIFASGLTNPSGLAFDSAGNLYVTCQSNGTNGAIMKFTPDGSQSTFDTGLISPIGIVITPGSTLNVSIKMFAGIILNNGHIGSNYLVQAASNLSSNNWITLTNVTLPSNPYIYIDYGSPTNSQQFYRVQPQ